MGEVTIGADVLCFVTFSPCFSGYQSGFGNVENPNTAIELNNFNDLCPWNSGRDFKGSKWVCFRV